MDVAGAGALRPRRGTHLVVSKRPEDLRLVAAAAKGDLRAVEAALPEAVVEAHVRLPGVGYGS